MITPVNPEALGAPKGYSNGMLAPAGARLLAVAGQIGWDREHRFVGSGFVEQFAQALDNVLAVVHEAGGGPQSIMSMRIFVTSRQEYDGLQREVGAAWRARMGKHFPAMALVEVSSLLELEAKVELEALAAV